jgi:hypothetical protein
MSSTNEDYWTNDQETSVTSAAINQSQVTNNTSHHHHQRSRRAPDWKWSPEEIGIVHRALDTNSSVESVLKSFRAINSSRNISAIAVRFAQESKKRQQRGLQQSFPATVISSPVVPTTTVTPPVVAQQPAAVTPPVVPTTTVTPPVVAQQPAAVTPPVTTTATVTPPPKTVKRSSIMALIGDLIEISSSSISADLKKEMLEFKRAKIDTSFL